MSKSSNRFWRNDSNEQELAHFWSQGQELAHFIRKIGEFLLKGVESSNRTLLIMPRGMFHVALLARYDSRHLSKKKIVFDLQSMPCRHFLHTKTVYSNLHEPLSILQNTAGEMTLFSSAFSLEHARVCKCLSEASKACQQPVRIRWGIPQKQIKKRNGASTAAVSIRYRRRRETR
jgi:hypothetical protein